MDKKKVTFDPKPLLDDQTVVEYLKSNPHFFIRNATAVEQIRVPHSVHHAVSLVEWSMKRQRVYIQNLEQGMQLLIEQARNNEILFNQLLKLVIQLSTADNFIDFQQRLCTWSRSFGLSGAYVRLFSECWQLGVPMMNTQKVMISRQAFEPVRIQRFGEKNHYLGTLNNPEILLLIPDANHVGSVAISLLGMYGNLGMLIFSSLDIQHYKKGMGTMMLDHLAKLLPDLLLRWITPCINSTQQSFPAAN
ncbi:MAG: DUF484 domain-containing protein [Arsenophonus sp. NC-PG7-MAG3]